jgi:hypothetical protein
MFGRHTRVFATRNCLMPNDQMARNFFDEPTLDEDGYPIPPPKLTKLEPSGSTIIVQAGLRHEAADAGLAAMIDAGIEFYQRDRSMVRVCAVSAKASDGTAVTSPGIVNVTLPMLCL